jgi:Protein of unknown function (DUF3558)
VLNLLTATRNRISDVLFLSLLFYGLIGCSSQKSTPAEPAQSGAIAGTPTESKSSLPDPCKLLTKDEAEGILGEPIRDPEPGGLGGNRICDWKSVALHGGISPYSIHIALIRQSKNVWDAGKKLYGKEMRPIPGLGDDAYFLTDDLQLYDKQLSITINVLKSIDKPDHAKAVEKAELAVAQRVVSRV